MRKAINMIIVAALAAVGMVEAKPEVRPEMPVRPIEMKVEGKKEMPKFHGKRHGHKHHARPHGKRFHKHGVRPEMRKRPVRKPMMNAPIVRPVRKACPAIKRVK